MKLKIKMNYMQKAQNIAHFKQASKKMKLNLTDRGKNKNSQHLIKMMYHLAANGMEIITVVHTYDALFIILFNILSKPKKWKKIFKDPNQYLSTLHDGFQRYPRGVLFAPGETWSRVAMVAYRCQPVDMISLLNKHTLSM